MIGKLIRAEIGRRVAGRVAGSGNGMKGALIGAAAPYVLRGMSARAGLLIAGAFAAKKLFDRKREHDRTNLALGRVARSGPGTMRQSAPPTPSAVLKSSRAE